jgi:hypothetical protein
MTNRKTPTRVLTLTRLGDVYYPQSEADYSLLSDLGTPMVQVKLTHLGLLKSFCAQHKIKVIELAFEDLEKEMLTKVQRQWKWGLIVAPHQIVLHYPKTLKSDSPDTLADALQDWYAKRQVRTEVVRKKTASSKRIVIKKHI